jgi:hypothetical protein
MWRSSGAGVDFEKRANVGYDPRRKENGRQGASTSLAGLTSHPVGCTTEDQFRDRFYPGALPNANPAAPSGAHAPGESHTQRHRACARSIGSPRPGAAERAAWSRKAQSAQGSPRRRARESGPARGASTRAPGDREAAPYGERCRSSLRSERLASRLSALTGRSLNPELSN